MRIKEVVAEDFLNFKKPSMFILSAVCDWKCCREAGIDDVCQNKHLEDSPTVEISNEAVFRAYHENDITKAVVIGGLEPMLQIREITDLIRYFRSHDELCQFVIYTGYDRDEVAEYLSDLKSLGNIIIKFGRYLPDRPERYDGVLGVTLSSDNQYAVEL